MVCVLNKTAKGSYKQTYFATLLITGAKLVGPYSCTILKLWKYASRTPFMPPQFGFSLSPFWNRQTRTRFSKRICVSLSDNSPFYLPHQWENMGDSAVRGQLGSKTVGREELVTVVVLDNLSHSFQGHCICIHLIRTHIMEGGGLRGITLEERRTQSNKSHMNNTKCHLPCFHAAFCDVAINICTLHLLTGQSEDCNSLHLYSDIYIFFKLKRVHLHNISLSVSLWGAGPHVKHHLINGH